jgi:hypothetical protein
MWTALPRPSALSLRRTPPLRRAVAPSLPAIALPAQHPQIPLAIPSPRGHRPHVVHLQLHPIPRPAPTHRALPPAALQHAPPHRWREGSAAGSGAAAEEFIAGDEPALEANELEAGAADASPAADIGGDAEAAVPPQKLVAWGSAEFAPHVLEVGDEFLGVIAAAPDAVNPDELQGLPPGSEAVHDGGGPEAPPFPAVELPHRVRAPVHPCRVRPQTLEEFFVREECAFGVERELEVVAGHGACGLWRCGRVDIWRCCHGPARTATPPPAALDLSH